MKVLATTSQSVLLVDCVTGEARVLHRGAGLYYGIARTDTGYVVAARRRLVSSDVPRDDERGIILRFDSAFRETAPLEAPFPLRDMHEITSFDGCLWVTCSYDDLVAIHDGNEWQRWSPAVPPPPPGRPFRGAANDRHHFNSFHVEGAEFALLAHNHGPSDIHFFDRHTLAWRRSFELGRQAHNIWRQCAAYATCSSFDGKLLDTEGWELETGGFPRGVAFESAYRAVGISALSERGQRDFASAAIAVHDASWRRVHYVHLPHEGMILDLEPLQEAEYASAAKRGLGARSFPILDRLDETDLAADQGSATKVST